MHIQRIQKALVEMNVQLSNVISDISGKTGPAKAITAMARKLACLIYRMLKFGQAYVDKGVEHYEQRWREQRLKWLKRQAKDMGMQLLEGESIA